MVSMLKTYFRGLRKDLLFSAINILGLALGLAVCLLIALFVRDELSYDYYNEHSDRIFRLAQSSPPSQDGIAKG
jgi:putative ABC transport system permease protein